MYGGLYDERTIVKGESELLCSVLDYIFGIGKTYMVLSPNGYEVIVVEEVLSDEGQFRYINHRPLTAERQKEIYDIFFKTNEKVLRNIGEYVSAVEVQSIRARAKEKGIEVIDFVRWNNDNYLITAQEVLKCLRESEFELLKDEYLISCIKEIAAEKNISATWEEVEKWIVEEEESSEIKKTIINTPYGSGYVDREMKGKFVYEGKEYVLLESLDSEEFNPWALRVVQGMCSGEDYYVCEDDF